MLHLAKCAFSRIAQLSLGVTMGAQWRATQYTLVWR